MSSTYNGVPLDLPVPGYSNVPSEVLAASNKIGLVDKQIANIDSISKNYTNAFNAYTKEAAFNRTTNPRSNDVATYNAAIASNANMINLRLELAKWENIVQKNGGSLALKAQPNGAYAADPEPNFLSVRSKLEKDKQTPNLVLKNAGPEITSKLPPFDKSYQVILADAVKKNEEQAAPAIARAKAQDEYQRELASLTNPNQSSLDKGYADRNSVAGVTGLLNKGVSSGALVWDLATLKVAAQTTAKGKALSNSELASLVRGFPKGTTLQQVQLALNKAASVSNSAPVINKAKPAAGGVTSVPKPKPAPTPPPRTGGGFPLPKPTPNTPVASPIKPKPPTPVAQNRPGKPSPRPTPPRPTPPKPRGR